MSRPGSVPGVYAQPYRPAYGAPAGYVNGGAAGGFGPRPVQKVPSSGYAPKPAQYAVAQPQSAAPRAATARTSQGPYAFPQAPQQQWAVYPQGQIGYAPVSGYGFSPYAPGPAFYRPRAVPSGPQLPFTKELLDRVPQENVGASLPFLSEVVQKAEHFVHPLPQDALPFLQELKETTPAVVPSDVPIARFGVTNKLSQAVVFNGVAYLSGQVPGDRSGDIAAQTREVLEKIEYRLKELGSDKSKLLDATVLLANIKDAKAFNAVWEEWVPAGTAPARTTFEAKLVNPEWKVEIRITAAITH